MVGAQLIAEDAVKPGLPKEKVMPTRKPVRSKKAGVRSKPPGWGRRKEAGWDSRFIRGKIAADDGSAISVSEVIIVGFSFINWS